MIADDLFLGIVAAIVVFRYEKERSRLVKKLRSFVR